MGAKACILFIACLILGLTIGLASSSPFAQEGGGFGIKANLDLPFDAAGPEDDEDEEEAPEIVVFYGQQFESDGIFFCVDKSGSMTGQAWKRCQDEVVRNILQFSEKVQFGIVFFDDRISKFPKTNRPAEATPAMKVAAQAMVMSVQPGNGSCYVEGIIEALNFANLSTVKRRLVILLGDGEVICNGNLGIRQQCLDEVKSRNTSGVKINTLCISCQSEDFMKALAAQNGGSFARVQ